MGGKRGLRFELSLSLRGPAERRALAWGKGLVYLDDAPVWSGGTTSTGVPRPVEGAWIDLLDHLAGAWPWLALEEGCPGGYNSRLPGDLRREAAQRWGGSEDQIPDAEEEALYRYETRHDLARALSGIRLPRLFLLREGRDMWICSPDTCTTQPFEEVIGVLEDLGDFLARAVADVAEGRGRQAVERWRRRQERMQERFFELRTGLESSLLEALSEGVDPVDFWEWEGDPAEDTELMAAARMGAAALSVPQQKQVLERMRRLRKKTTSALNDLAEKARESLGANADATDFEQGYALAHWLRRELDEEQAVDPESLCREWGVTVDRIRLDDCDLHAVACWGKRHGPAVLLNTGNRAKPSGRAGRRSTLAHEVCHLLMDRARTLPAAEVLGGSAPLWAERRANAFAAEFLLPRELAMASLRKGDSAEIVLKYLTQTYGVSRQLAALQICNHPSFPQYLQPEDLRFIKHVAKLAAEAAAPW
jgi:Zn-dependent peptidase ImmA (M78 family)